MKATPSSSVLDAENLKVAWRQYYMEVLSDDMQLHRVVNMH